MSTAVSLRPERVYLRFGARWLIASLGGLAWASFSFWFSLPWIAELGRTVTLPVALAAVLATAVVPGFMTFRLAACLLLERPKRLRLEGPFPAVSVLLVVRDAEDRIEKSITHALRQDYPGGIEVVVADDGSTDGTAAIVRARAERDRRVRLVELPRSGEAPTLQAALDASTAPLVAALDTKTQPMPFALRRAVARLMAAPASSTAVAGALLPGDTGGRIRGDLERGGFLLRDRAASGGPVAFEPSAVALADRRARLRSFLPPYVDAVCTLTVLPGIALALAGTLSLLGPPALAVLPLSGLVAGIVFVRHRRALDEVGLAGRRPVAGLIAYVVLYPAVLAPLSLAGYVKQLVRQPNRIEMLP
jgi:hypothetical protein